MAEKFLSITLQSQSSFLKRVLILPRAFLMNANKFLYIDINTHTESFRNYLTRKMIFPTWGMTKLFFADKKKTLTKIPNSEITDFTGLGKGGAYIQKRKV